MFSCLIDDILPSGSGPYLVFSYLEEWYAFSFSLPFLSFHQLTEWWPTYFHIIVMSNSFFLWQYHCSELAITANRKNADQHVVYLSWSLGEESNKAVIVDIVRDNLKPRIELQGSQNFVLD